MGLGIKGKDGEIERVIFIGRILVCGGVVCWEKEKENKLEEEEMKGEIKGKKED